MKGLVVNVRRVMEIGEYDRNLLLLLLWLFINHHTRIPPCKRCTAQPTRENILMAMTREIWPGHN